MDMAEVLMGLFMIVYYLVIIVFGVAMYVLSGLGLMKMAKTCGLAHPWMGFVPYANTYLLGKLAEQNPTPGKKSWPWRHIALIGQIVVTALTLAMTFWMLGDVLATVMSGAEFTEYDALSLVGGTLAFAAPISLLSTAYSVAVYIIYWKVFSLFAPRNTAVIFLVLTILAGLAPIFLFILRNKQPQNRPAPTDPDSQTW